MARQGGTNATDAVSKEMEAQLLQLEKESKVDPAAETILQGLKQVAYLVEKGYQGDGTKPVDFFNTEWITAKNSMGMNVAMLPDQVLVKDSNGGPLDKVIYGDQVPLYEQWQEDKKAFEVAALKEYAAEKLPQVQKSIEDFPKKINPIIMAFAAKKAAIIEKLPEDALKDEYLENMKAISDLAKEINGIEPGDGKELLDLLSKMMDKQRENVLSLGGHGKQVWICAYKKWACGKQPIPIRLRAKELPYTKCVQAPLYLTLTNGYTAS